MMERYFISVHLNVKTTGIMASKESIRVGQNYIEKKQGETKKQINLKVYPETLLL